MLWRGHLNLYSQCNGCEQLHLEYFAGCCRNDFNCWCGDVEFFFFRYSHCYRCSQWMQQFYFHSFNYSDCHGCAWYGVCTVGSYQ